jgi:hypothetical protein
MIILDPRTDIVYIKQVGEGKILVLLFTIC